ncbi:MAG: pentapeptide repeat-containing protein [Leptolyngbyaceae cyanobacterium MO_188.B28]|nr:pentapeptide repeat-containing protein [Leptolyngbyaceae cyanobacterium MO_188.B28]
MSLDPQSPQRTKLFIEQRLKLIDTLSRLPLSQLLQIEITLGIPQAVMPGLVAELGLRSAALLRYTESPQGKGLEALLTVLAHMGLQPFGDKLNQDSSEHHPSCPRRLKIRLDADISELDRDKVKGLLTEIQQIAGDFSIETSHIKYPGSIEIDLEGPEAALERLRQQIVLKEIMQVLELQIQEVGFTEIEPCVEGLNLQFADLGSANLCSADLSSADLSSADLHSSNLHSSNLSEANLSFANLSNANFSFSDLRHAEVSFAGVNETDLSNANLSFANLSFADLSFANLSNANLGSADLGSANLSFADLSSANLSNTNFSFADLSFADLSFANLSNANLSSADLIRANLFKANLRNADLRDADLSNADLSNADLSNAEVTSATFGGNLGLSAKDKNDFRGRGAIFVDDPEMTDNSVIGSNP